VSRSSEFNLSSVISSHAATDALKYFRELNDQSGLIVKVHLTIARSIALRGAISLTPRL